MNLKQELNLQLFADAGTLVNASGNYVNAYSGETNAFPEGGGMTASMKTFYDTELLTRARALGTVLAGLPGCKNAPVAVLTGRTVQSVSGASGNADWP